MNMDDTASWKVVDSEDGKTINLYRSSDAAHDAALRMHEEQPKMHLLVVSMDEKGKPVRFEELRPRTKRHHWDVRRAASAGRMIRSAARSGRGALKRAAG
jgi:ribosomal protein S17